MTRRTLSLFALMLSLLVALPAAAQLSPVPGNGPLYPGGPRQGLGPPSLGDNVPDLRLRPGGPAGLSQTPIYGGGSYGAPRSPGATRFVPDRETRIRRSHSGAGRECRTTAKTCLMAAAKSLGSGCSCRLSAGRRARGVVH